MKNFFGSLIGIISSLLVASCCLGPTLFLIFGVSVGSLSSLTSLEPYRPYLVALGYLGVGYSFYSNYLKKPRCECKEQRIGRALTWISFLLLTVATLYPYLLEKIYGGA